MDELNTFFSLLQIFCYKNVSIVRKVTTVTLCGSRYKVAISYKLCLRKMSVWQEVCYYRKMSFSRCAHAGAWHACVCICVCVCVHVYGWGGWETDGKTGVLGGLGLYLLYRELRRCWVKNTRINIVKSEMVTLLEEKAQVAVAIQGFKICAGKVYRKLICKRQ